MKKIHLAITSCLLGILLLSSCKKDYSCTCTVDKKKYIYEYPGQLKSEAKEACDQQGVAARLADPEGSCSLTKD